MMTPAERPSTCCLSCALVRACGALACDVAQEKDDTCYDCMNARCECAKWQARVLPKDDTCYDCINARCECAKWQARVLPDDSTV